MLNWTTTDRHALAHGIKVAVHGMSGAGKTRLIETLPTPAIGSAESGTLSIAGARLPLCEIGTLQQLQEFYDWSWRAPEARNFQSISLDSVTEIAERILGVEKLKAKDPRKAYGEMMDQIFAMLRLFRDLPGKHVYFSVKSSLTEQPDGSHMWAPMMPGNKTGQQLPYYFDEFFYLGVGEYDAPPVAGQPPHKMRYRYLQTQRTPLIEAKDRSGALADIEEPNLTKIFAKITAAFSRAN